MLDEKHKELVDSLVGKVIDEIQITNDKLVFMIKTAWKKPKESYVFNGGSDCCDETYIADICGELTDLLGEPLLISDVSINNDRLSEEESKKPTKYRAQECHTWTFYRFSTSRGNVTIRWLGTSNGCYSEKVSLQHIIGE